MRVGGIFPVPPEVAVWIFPISAGRVSPNAGGGEKFRSALENARFFRGTAPASPPHGDARICKSVMGLENVFARGGFFSGALGYGAFWGRQVSGYLSLFLARKFLRENFCARKKNFSGGAGTAGRKFGGARRRGRYPRSFKLSALFQVFVYRVDERGQDGRRLCRADSPYTHGLLRGCGERVGERD